MWVHAAELCWLESMEEVKQEAASIAKAIGEEPEEI